MCLPHCLVCAESAFCIGNSHCLVGAEWATLMKRVTPKACDGLGVPPEDVAAELYKLVLYEAGSFFVPHRNTEKADGMFGTMVIDVPSIYKVLLLAVNLGNATLIMVPFGIVGH